MIAYYDIAYIDYSNKRYSSGILKEEKHFPSILMGEAIESFENKNPECSVIRIKSSNFDSFLNILDKNNGNPVTPAGTTL